MTRLRTPLNHLSAVLFSSFYPDNTKKSTWTGLLSFLLIVDLVLVGCCHPCDQASATRAHNKEHFLAPVVRPTPGQPNYAGMTTSPLAQSLKESAAAHQLHNKKSAHDLSAPGPGGPGGPGGGPDAGPGAFPIPPLDTTVNAVLSPLKAVMDNLNTLLNNATQDIKAAGASLEGNAQSLVAQIDARLGNRLSQTMAQLDSTEQNLMANAARLTAQMQFAAQQFATQTTENVILAIHEADITAYAAEANLPCQERDPRVLYVASNSEIHPLYLRAGLDSPEIRIRGNFLAYSVPTVTIEGQAAHLNYFNSEEVSVDIPSSVLSGLQNEHRARISLAPSSCHPHWYRKGTTVPGPVQQVGFLLKPEVHVAIQASVGGKADEPRTPLTWPLDFYDSSDDCDADYDDTRTWCLPTQTPDPNAATIPPTLLTVPQPWNIFQTTVGGQSGYSTPTLQGNACVTVPARLKANGKSWFTCHGRGWLGYHIDLLYTGYVTTPLTEQPFTAAPAQNTPSVEFVYNLPIPPGSQKVVWDFSVLINRTEGGVTIPIRLSRNSPSVSGYSASFDATAQKLAITLAPLQ